MVRSAPVAAVTSIGREMEGKLGGQLMRGIVGSLFKEAGNPKSFLPFPRKRGRRRRSEARLQERLVEAELTRLFKRIGAQAHRAIFADDLDRKSTRLNSSH